MLSNIVVHFLGKALTISKETLRSSVGTWHRRWGPRPVLAWLWIGSVHCPSMSRPQGPVGQPSPAPRVQVWFSWGGRCSTEAGSLRPGARRGSSGGTKRVAEGLSPRWLGRLPTPSACRRPPWCGGHREEGRSPRVRQRLSEQQGWASNLGRTRVAPRPEGWVRHRVPPTAPTTKCGA